MRSVKFIILVLLLMLLLCSQLCAKVTVQRIVYRGWADSYKLTAEPYNLVVVPEIGGRIMEYSYGGHNVIWEDPDEYGMTYPVAKEWHNFGGSKTWVAPQTLWGWPPDPMMDFGKANVEIRQNPKGLPVIKITGAPSLDLGIVVTREITLDDTGEVTLKQRLHNIGGKTVSCSVWDVTYVKTPGLVAFPVKQKSKFPGGIAYFNAESKNSKQYSVRDNLSITNYMGEQGLIGSDSDGPWMISFQNDLAYVKLFDPMKKGVEYPNNGCSVQVFTSDAKYGYLEMEVFGPVTDIKPGEHTEISEQWRILKLSQPVKDENWVVKAVNGMKGKNWIP
ncbi:MAG: DUF4380 domain-containing protein [Armatimonadota bacterium]